MATINVMPLEKASVHSFQKKFYVTCRMVRVSICVRLKLVVLQSFHNQNKRVEIKGKQSEPPEYFLLQIYSSFNHIHTTVILADGNMELHSRNMGFPRVPNFL